MYAKGDFVEIADESMLPAESSRLFKHYPNGARVVVTDVFYGFVTIQAESNVSSITLAPEELTAIRNIGG